MPRRGRGVDFEHRFRTSRWAEDLLLRSFDESEYVAVRIGLSEISADGIIPDLVLAHKVPDLLVFDRRTLGEGDRKRLDTADLTKLSAVQLDPASAFGRLFRKARFAVEVEFSPYKAAEMSDRGWQPRTKELIERRQRIAAEPKIPVAPNIWIKDQDLQPLLAWQTLFKVPVLVFHVFDQEAFCVKLDQVEAFRASLTGDPRADSILQQSSGFFTKIQNYDRQDLQAAGERKRVYVVTPAASVKIGDIKNVRIESQLGMSTSMKYVAHVLFAGGELEFTQEFLDTIASL